MVDDRRRRLLDLARLFLRLGATAFGGPAAHIALFEEEVVGRRGWLTREALLDYLAAANLIPGPNSTELALYIGQARAGLPGLLTAGTAFILPAGPNNPVGILWMGLSKPHVGIHGTNQPETIGRAASHGCIRTANWDAARVKELVTVGNIVSIF